MLDFMEIEIPKSRNSHIRNGHHPRVSIPATGGWPTRVRCLGMKIWDGWCIDGSFARYLPNFDPATLEGDFVAHEVLKNMPAAQLFHWLFGIRMTYSAVTLGEAIVDRGLAVTLGQIRLTGKYEPLMIGIGAGNIFPLRTNLPGKPVCLARLECLYEEEKRKDTLWLSRSELDPTLPVPGLKLIVPNIEL